MNCRICNSLLSMEGAGHHKSWCQPSISVTLMQNGEGFTVRTSEVAGGKSRIFNWRARRMGFGMIRSFGIQYNQEADCELRITGLMVKYRDTCVSKCLDESG